MNLDPQKFFIGLMDFFSILLPGALLTYLLMGEVRPVVLGDRYAKLDGAQAWVAFLFASYLFGHLVFLLGSWLDEFYDWARRYTLNTQIKMLARRGRLLPWLARALIWLVFKGERNLAVDRAGKIKQQALGALQAEEAMNNFQWCKSALNVESPASLAVVQRFEADSKFFRYLTVVLLLVLVTWPLKHTWPLAGIPTHIGGAVFRLRGVKAEYLLVGANSDPAKWVLPKGIVEAGEQHRETAVREVHEETGVWARVVRELDDCSYSVNGQVIGVKCYLMEAAGSGLRTEKDRQHVWLSFPDAVARASHLETRELLQAAQQRRVRSER